MNSILYWIYQKIEHYFYKEATREQLEERMYLAEIRLEEAKDEIAYLKHQIKRL